jgi:hypothetical protein
VPDEARAETQAAKLEKMTEARARYHRKYYGEPVQDIEPVYALDHPPDLPPQAGESLEDYLDSIGICIFPFPEVPMTQ